MPLPEFWGISPMLFPAHLFASGLVPSGREGDTARAPVSDEMVLRRALAPGWGGSAPRFGVDEITCGSGLGWTAS